MVRRYYFTYPSKALEIFTDILVKLRRNATINTNKPLNRLHPGDIVMIEVKCNAGKP